MTDAPKKSRPKAEPLRISVRFANGRIVPADHASAEIMDQWSVDHGGSVFDADLKPSGKRSVKHNRLFWGAMSVAADCANAGPISDPVNAEDMRRALFIRTGNVEIPRLDRGHADPITGEIVPVYAVRSIAFDRMSQPDFNTLFSDCIHALRDLLPHFDGSEQKTRLERLLRDAGIET